MKTARSFDLLGVQRATLGVTPRRHRLADATAGHRIEDQLVGRLPCLRGRRAVGSLPALEVRAVQRWRQRQAIALAPPSPMSPWQTTAVLGEEEAPRSTVLSVRPSASDARLGSHMVYAPVASHGDEHEATMRLICLLVFMRSLAFRRLPLQSGESRATGCHVPVVIFRCSRSSCRL